VFLGTADPSGRGVPPPAAVPEQVHGADDDTDGGPAERSGHGTHGTRSGAGETAAAVDDDLGAGPLDVLDLIVDVGDGEPLRTSRVMLASFSDVFFKMLTAPMREATERRVYLPGAPAAALFAMFSLLAGPGREAETSDGGGNTPGVGAASAAGSGCSGSAATPVDFRDLSPPDLVETLAWALSLSHRFQTPRATHLIHDVLSRSVTAETAVRCLGIAEEFRLGAVRSRCVAVAAEGFTLASLPSNGWIDLPVTAAADVLCHHRLRDVCFF
jgi:hypothetical protein